MTANKPYSCKLLGNYEIRPGIASIPESPDYDELKNSEYVILKSGNKEKALKAEFREGATGNIIFVYPNSLGANNKSQIDCEVTLITSSKYKRYLLLRTRQGRQALFGLALAIIGIIIDVSLKIGGVIDNPLIVISSSTHSLLILAASVCQIFGLIIVFGRAVRRNDL